MTPAKAVNHSRKGPTVVNYIARQMKEVGLKPINGDSYLQQVNIISSRTQCPKPMVLSTPEGKISLIG